MRKPYMKRPDPKYQAKQTDNTANFSQHLPSPSHYSVAQLTGATQVPDLFEGVRLVVVEHGDVEGRPEGFGAREQVVSVSLLF